MPKILFILICLFGLAACAGGSGVPGMNLNNAPRDQIEAENRLMRNNLSLAMRENKVLKEENLRYKSEVTQLSDCVSRLTAEIEAMEGRHRDRLAEIKTLFDQLRLQQNEMEMDYCWTVDELRSANIALGQETTAKLEEMTAALKSRDEAFKDTIAAVKTDFNGKLEKYAREAANLGRLLAETQTTLKDIGERVENFSLARQEARSQMDDIQQSIADIRRKIADVEHALQTSASSVPDPAGPAAVGGAGEAQGAE